MNPKRRAIAGMRMDEAVQTALNPKQKWHPVVSPVQFAAASSEPFAGQMHGASMNVHTGEQIDIGTGQGKGFLVGGAKSEVTGKRIPTLTSEGPHKGELVEPALKDVIGMRNKLAREQAGNPNAIIGSWVDEANTPNTDIDASEIITNKRKAKKAMKRRKERAIVDIPSGDSIENEKLKK